MKPGVFPASWKLSMQVSLIWSTAASRRRWYVIT